MQQSPYFGINYGWPYGSDGWNTGMDENLIRLSFLARNAVNEFVDTLPESPVPGYSCILNSDGMAYVWLEDGYTFTPLEDGYKFLTLVDGKYWRKEGPSYIEIPSPISLDDRATSLESRMGVVENDLSQVISDASDTAQEVGDILSDASALPVTSDSVTQSLAAWMDFVRNRSNHTGTQEASTISDFALEVVDSFLNQLYSRTMTASVSGGALSLEGNNDLATEIVSDGAVLELPDSGGVYSPLHENISNVVILEGEIGAICRIIITFRQDDTTPYTVTGWDSNITWLSGSPPTIDSTLGSETLIELVNIDNKGWLGWKVGVDLDFFSPVATTGSYNDLIDTPTLGSAASEDIASFDPAGAAEDVNTALTILINERMSSAARDAVNALDPATATLEDLITALQLT